MCKNASKALFLLINSCELTVACFLVPAFVPSCFKTTVYSRACVFLQRYNVHKSHFVLSKNVNYSNPFLHSGPFCTTLVSRFLPKP